MGDIQGFLKHGRELPTRRPVPVRLKDWQQVYQEFPSDPLQTHRTLLEARRRGHPRDTLLQVFHNNPATFFGQNPRFRPRPLRVTELPSAAPGRPL